MTGWRDDQALVDACRAGQTQAFGELVRRHKDRLYPTLLRLCGSADDADDLLQDAFVRAFEKLGQYHGESSFYTWLYRLAVNLALSGRRRRRKPPIRLAEVRPDGDFDPADDPEQSDPALPLMRDETDRRVQEALNALAPDHRDVIVLKEFDGRRYDEVAALLKIPVGTVRSRLHRARLELRERLRGLAEEPRPVRGAPADPG